MYSSNKLGKTLFLVLIYFFTLGLFSQSKKVADKYFSQFSYQKAASIYQQIYQKGDDSKYILSRLADCYYMNAETDIAEKWYKELIDKHEVDADYKFKYAQVLRSNGKYKLSDSILSILGKDTLLKDNEDTDFLLSKENTIGKRISIRNLAINTPYSDFGASIFNNQVYFASASPLSGSKKQKLYRWNNQPFLDLYKADAHVTPLIGTEKDTIFFLKNKEPLSKSINTQYHESNAIFTKDGKVMYFTRVNSSTGKRAKRDKKNTINLKLFKATLIKGKWDDITELPFNSDEYSVGHPALSPDEKTLYFTSDMPGSYGQTDLYKVSVDGDNFGEPVNLGPKINTSNKEMFPFVGENNTLYFSSNGHLGLGLLDIFQSKIKEDGSFSKVANIGKPFNSVKDDFAFFVDKEGKKGLFSSNRYGGKGDDDIYSFIIYQDIPEVCMQNISGVITNKQTGKPITSVTVKLIDNNGEIVDEVMSDDKGEYLFQELSCQDTKYSILTEKLNYRTQRKNLNLFKFHESNTTKLNFSVVSLIVGDQIVVDPIHFDSGQSIIREDAQYTLEDVVSVLTYNPEMVIKIESHTDCLGNTDYNKNLSEQRAKSTKDYIVSRGISSDRIVSAIGYGEEKLLNNCNDANASTCSEEEHKVNRRSYFYIVKRGSITHSKKNNKTAYGNTKNRSTNRQRLIKKKRKSKSNLLKLLNSFKKSRAKNRKSNKCYRSEDTCEKKLLDDY